MSDLAIALIGGAIGSVATAGLTQLGRARVAWHDVALHDLEAAERNAQLIVWVDDRTRQLVIDMSGVTNDCAGRELSRSSIQGGGLQLAKEQALHEYRDEEWRARLDLFQLRAREGSWHALWRRVRRRPAPSLTARAEVEPFLERWREPVTPPHQRERGSHGAGSHDPHPRRCVGRATRATADVNSLSNDDGWVRLADLRLPRWWPLWSIVVMLFQRRKQSRQLEDAVTGMSELAEVIAQRWQEGDERERQMLKLTRRLERLTWAVVALCIATLGVTVWAVLHG